MLTRATSTPVVEHTLLETLQQRDGQPAATAALVTADSVWSADQVTEAAERVARAVAPRVTTGEAVVVACADPIWRHVAYLGVGRVGAIAVSLPPGSALARAQQQAGLSEASHVIHDGDAAWAAAIAPRIPAIPVQELASEAAAHRLPTDVTAHHPCHIAFTSGSTGTPKPTYATHASAVAGMLHIAESLDIGIADRLSHLDMGGFGGLWGHPTIAMLRGASMHFFDFGTHGPGRLADWIDDSRLTYLMGVPSIWRLLVASLTPGRKLSSVRAVQFGGEAAHVADATAILRHLEPDAVVFGGYGTSEHHTLAWGPVQPRDIALGGVIPAGWPLPDQPIIAVDAEDNEVAVGELGRLVVTGRHFSNKSPRPETLGSADPAPFRREFTGDEGRILSDGRILVVGRADDAFNVAGNRIDPSEVESAIMTHPDIAEAAVMADAAQEAVVAVIALVPEHQARDGFETELRTHVRERLPAAMVPSKIHLVESLPRMATGKVDRLGLTRSFAGAQPHTPS